MARAMTNPEKAQAHQIWPRMNVNAVVVTDEPTNRYNCLSWTLGITTSWVWPWGPRNATKPEFDALYRGYGFKPAGSGPIAAFGLNLNSMTHGSVSGPGHGPRWESKCGAWLRIQHGLGEMEGGTLYGNVLGFYARRALRIVDNKETTARLKAIMAELKLAKAELKFLKDRVQVVDKALRDQFEQNYKVWKESWSHPLVVISSNPADRTQSLAFLELIALGPTILPLLMEKLTDPDEFFALQAVDRLLRPELTVSRELDDESILLGEQGRAIETVRGWIHAEA